MKIVFLDRETLPESIVLKRPSFEHVFETHARTDPANVAERIVDAEIVITNKVPIGRNALAGAKNLKFIAIAATGYDIVDISACRMRGVGVSNIVGYAVDTGPGHTFALILALRRSLLAYRESVREGRWQDAGQFCYFDYPINGLAGATLGIIGGGKLGSAVGSLGEAFGMRSLIAGRKSGEIGDGRTPFDQMLAESDIISLHCPLTPETRNILGAAEFAAMARRPLIINTARGGLVDETALLAAIESGQVSGAGIDVTTPEPPLADGTIMKLADHPNVIVTPHVSWASHEAIQALADQLIGNIELFVAGRPRNLIV